MILEPEVPLTAHQIQQAIHGGPGTGAMEYSQKQALDLSIKAQDRADTIQALTREIEESWEGEASNAALEKMRLFVATAKGDAEKLIRAHGAITSQMTAFGNIHAAVVPVSENPPEFTKEDFDEGIIQGFDIYNNKLAKWQKNVDNNIAAFAEYHEISVQNGNAMPTDYATIAARSPFEETEYFIVDDDGGENPGDSGKDPQPGGGTPPPPQQPPPNTGWDPTQDHPSSDNNTHTAGFTRTPRPPQNFDDGYELHTPVFDPAPGNNYPTSGGGVRGGYGTSAGIGTGTGSGTGNPGSSGRSTPEPGKAGRMSGIRAPLGEQPRFPAGITPGEAGKPGNPGMPMGGAPGGSGGRGEDTDHQRPSYLINPDPDSIFGSDEKTTPAVIGDINPQ